MIVILCLSSIFSHSVRREVRGKQKKRQEEREEEGGKYFVYPVIQKIGEFHVK